MLTPAQIQKFRALGDNPEVEFRTSLKRTYEETTRYLVELQRCVNEGKRIDEASNFCRWFRFSGIEKLLRCSPELSVDTLTRRLGDILYDVGLVYSGKGGKPKVSQSDVSEILNKLETLIA